MTKKLAQKKKFAAEVGKVLQLVIHSIYTNKDIFLRELISNASDACDKFKYYALQDGGVDGGEQLKISVRIDKAKNIIIVEDNGIGMDYQDMVDNLGTIASSGTQRFLEQISESKASDPKLIGQFGVGFYSAFMVADLVTVYSTKHDQNQTVIWESDGNGEYSIKEATEAMPRGTRVELHIRSADVEFLEKYKIQHIIKTYSDHISFPIELIEEDKAEIVNAASALWTINASEITQERYDEFYHHVAHSPDTPWMTLHNKVEGNITYTNLLFIPGSKPFDLFHPQAKSRVKLYIKRVFISEDVTNLIPSYLRFLRGIIDSEDLPLNISRETLQNNALVAKIRKSLVKRVLSALKKKADTAMDDFTKFWSNFGEVMKEGLCEGMLEEKEEVLEVCRFYSTKSGDKLISLSQYLENMKDGQEEIFYITGNNSNILRTSPQLEGFIKRDIEVLLLSDHVDDFWVNVIHQYKNKPLKSAITAGIDLNKVDDISPDVETVENEKSSTELIKFIKDILGTQVKDVKVSTKLVDSPACIVIPEGAMNIRMEKLLIDQKQLNKRSSKILEINPKHFLIERIAESINDKKDPKIIDLVQVVFAQACLIEGEPIDNPQEFVQKLNNLL